jgi:uncharacterized cupin superfamily protein
MPNIFRPDWERQDPSRPKPFTARAAPVGHQAGGRRLGASVYELSPGEATFPFHYHFGNEELLIVLAGRPSLRSLDGMRQLEAGEVVAFPIGPAGAHRIDNRGNEPARLLMISTMRAPEVVVYPDSDKIGARSHVGAARPGEPERVRKNFRARDAVDYWDGEAADGP